MVQGKGKGWQGRGLAESGVGPLPLSVYVLRANQSARNKSRRLALDQGWFDGAGQGRGLARARVGGIRGWQNGPLPLSVNILRANQSARNKSRRLAPDLSRNPGLVDGAGHLGRESRDSRARARARVGGSRGWEIASFPYVPWFASVMVKVLLAARRLARRGFCCVYFKFCFG